MTVCVIFLLAVKRSSHVLRISCRKLKKLNKRRDTLITHCDVAWLGQTMPTGPLLTDLYERGHSNNPLRYGMFESKLCPQDRLLTCTRGDTLITHCDVAWLGQNYAHRTAEWPCERGLSNNPMQWSMVGSKLCTPDRWLSCARGDTLITQCAVVWLGQNYADLTAEWPVREVTF